MKSEYIIGLVFGCLVSSMAIAQEKQTYNLLGGSAGKILHDGVVVQSFKYGFGSRGPLQTLRLELQPVPTATAANAKKIECLIDLSRDEREPSTIAQRIERQKKHLAIQGVKALYFQDTSKSGQGSYLYEIYDKFGYHIHQSVYWKDKIGAALRLSISCSSDVKSSYRNTLLNRLSYELKFN